MNYSQHQFKHHINAHNTAVTDLTYSYEQSLAIAAAIPMPLIISRIDDNTILYANELVKSIFGRSPVELMGGKITHLYYYEAEQKQMLEMLAINQQVLNYHIHIKQINNKPLKISVSHQLFNWHGEPALLSTFANNYSDNNNYEIKQETEAALKLAEEQLETILEAIPGIVSWISSDLRYLGVNRHLAEIYGLTPEEFQGKDIGFLGYSPLFNEFVTKFFASNENEALFELKTPTNKQHRSYLIIAQKYNQGKAAFLVGIDITYRREAEEALQASEAKLKFALKAAKMGVWDWDIQNDIFNVSEEVAEIYGRNIENLQNNNYAKYLEKVHPEDYDRVKEAMAKVIEIDNKIKPSDRNYDIEHRIIHPDGSIRWIAAKGAVRCDSNGTAIRITGTVMDITDRASAELALKRSETNIRAIFNSSVQAFILINRDYKIRAFNKTANEFAKLLLHTEMQPGDSIYNYILPQDINVFDLHFNQALQGKYVIAERKIKGINNPEIWLEIHYHPVFKENGDIIGVCMSSINIDDRKQALEALAQSEERFRSLVQNSSDIITILEADGTIRYESPSIQRILGYSPEDLIGKNIFNYVHPEDLEAVQNAFYLDLQKPNAEINIQLRFRHAKGEWIYLESIGSNLLNDAAINGFVINSRDISDRQRNQEKLRLLERAIQSSSNGIIITAAQNSDNGIVFVNKCFEELTGYTAKEVSEENCRFFQNHDINQIGLVALRQAIKKSDDSTVILRNYRKDGSLFWNELRVSPVYNEKGNLTNFIGIQTDITERKRAEEQLLHIAFHDSLTNLHNRSFLMERLEQATQRANREKNYQFALLFMDLDRFKIVNDSLGHRAGDELLKAIAKRLKCCIDKISSSWVPGSIWENNFCLDATCTLRKNTCNTEITQLKTTLARLGGDHFVILLEGITHIDDANRVAEAINEKIKHPFTIEGHEVYISASIGIAIGNVTELPDKNSLYNSNQQEKEKTDARCSLLSSSLCSEFPISSADLLRDADIAMYHAKAQGIGRYAIFDKAMHEQAVARLQLENDLRRAIERQEFILYYQPIVSLKTGWIVGFEALIRWQHPTQGIISPVKFIPIAEETGLIIPLGAWVLQKACHQLAIWKESIGIENYSNKNLNISNTFKNNYPLSISVNLSSKQFLQSDLVEQISQILRETRLDASSLKLEITESAIMQNTESATAMLLELRAKNIQLCLDDFGTGYSSLSYLHRFPIHTLKIDKSFVSRIGYENDHTEIVRAIIALAHALGMDAIAEGIEDATQLSQLRALNCEYGQGYYFSRPVNAETAGQLLVNFRPW